MAWRGITYGPAGNLQHRSDTSICGRSCDEKHCLHSTWILAVKAEPLRSLGHCPGRGVDFHQCHSQSKWSPALGTLETGAWKWGAAAVHTFTHTVGTVVVKWPQHEVDYWPLPRIDPCAQENHYLLILYKDVPWRLLSYEKWCRIVW